MIRRFLVISLFFCGFHGLSSVAHKPAKIVGLIQVRNEEQFLEQCLSALALYTDAIVILNDGSKDSTGVIIEKLKEPLHIEHVITHQDSSWQVRDERYNRNALLKAGREIGGTHFILIDADEMFTSLCKNNGWLRSQILALKPGQVMTFPMMNVWNSTDYYRDDKLCSPYDDHWRAIMCILCDDGACNYNDNDSHGSGVIHISREPKNRICSERVKTVAIKDINYGLVHFKCVNLNNIESKRVWYMCLEYIRANEIKQNKKANAHKLNKFYDRNVYSAIEKPILRKVPESWYKGYSFFDKRKFMEFSALRKDEVISWLKKYGPDYFKPLAIWNVDWVTQAADQLKRAKE